MTIDAYRYVFPNDEDQLLQAVARQPVTASIAGSSFSFQFYSKVCVNGLNSMTLNSLFIFIRCVKLTNSFNLCDRGFSPVHVRLLWIMLY